MTVEIDALDRSLERAGEDIVIRRKVNISGTMTDVDLPCRAFVRGVSADQIAGTITQADLNVTISPTQIVAAGWPAGDVAVGSVDKRIPRVTDAVIVQGKPRQVKNSKPIFVGSVWVRCDLVVAG